MPTPFVAMRIPFPVFAVTSMADKEKRNIVAVSGGGGELKYGIKNAVVSVCDATKPRGSYSPPHPE